MLSSRIEGTQATLSEVLKFQAGAEIPEESKRQDVQEIIKYRQALRAAENALKKCPINLNLLLELHSILLNSVRGRDKNCGHFRRTQNWIGVASSPIEKATFVLPDPMFLPEHLDNLEKYYHAEERDPLVQLAVVHAQFEIIHPFLDGNGRLGRILIPLFLYEKQLLSRPMFYLSNFLEAHRDEYIARLRGIQNSGGWDRWIAFFLGALVEQAEANAKTARAVVQLYETMKNRVVDLTHSQYAAPLLDRLFSQPVFQSTHLARQRGMPSKPMVMQMLGRCVKPAY